MTLPRPRTNAPAPTQAQLVASARDGSGAALGTLYGHHAQRLLAVAYRLLQSREDAEDVVHDVFVGLPELLRTYEERGAFAAWLSKVAARVALARMRDAEQRRTDPLDESARQVHAVSRDAVGTISLETAMRRLSPSLRAALVLKEIEGFSHAEVAQLLGISVGASEVRVHRAVQALRAELTKGE